MIDCLFVEVLFLFLFFFFYNEKGETKPGAKHYATEHLPKGTVWDCWRNPKFTMSLNLLEFVGMKQFSDAAEMSHREGCLFVQCFLMFLTGNASTAFHHYLFSLTPVLLLLCLPYVSFSKTKSLMFQKLVP